MASTSTVVVLAACAITAFVAVLVWTPNAEPPPQPDVVEQSESSGAGVEQGSEIRYAYENGTIRHLLGLVTDLAVVHIQGAPSGNYSLTVESGIYWGQYQEVRRWTKPFSEGGSAVVEPRVEFAQVRIRDDPAFDLRSATGQTWRVPLPPRET